MKNTIEISLDAVASVLPCLELREVRLAEEIANLQAQYAVVRTTIAELKAKMQGDELPLANGNFRKRSPKGHGERLIVNLLQSLSPGQGLTMAQIEEKTGINHATVHRTFNLPERNKGRFVSKKGLWRLADLHRHDMTLQSFAENERGIGKHQEQS